MTLAHHPFGNFEDLKVFSIRGANGTTNGISLSGSQHEVLLWVQQLMDFLGVQINQKADCNNCVDTRGTSCRDTTQFVS